MTKTIMILAIVAAFMVGTSMSFIVPNFEAEAKNAKITNDDLMAAILVVQEDQQTIQNELAETGAKQDLLIISSDAIKSTGNDHGVILDDLQSTGV